MQVDTIVSLSTPPGRGAIAVVRLSGPEAHRITERLVGGPLPAPRRATLAELRDPADGSLMDRALVTRFDAPASFTGEDLVELSCHGGWLVSSLVVDACRSAGARAAEPGEFTRRAYLHGKLDLVQVEAIADLIDARSRALHRAAVGQMERGLSERIDGLRRRMVHVEALLAHHVDFPEEDDAPVPLARVIEESAALLGEMAAMLAAAPEGELLREGALVVFAGRPNAGKSSLYNALIGEDRAIVTEVPGTTRDALEVVVQAGGYPFRLVDTAGLRVSEDTVERIGIEVAHQYLQRADVVLFCVPADEAVTEDDRAFLEAERPAPVVLVRTKADRTPAAGETGALPADSGPQASDDSVSRASDDPLSRPSDDPESHTAEGVVRGAAEGVVPGAVDEQGGAREKGTPGQARKLRVSARTGEGMEELRALLPELAYSALTTQPPEVPVLTRRRHADALRVAAREVGAFERGLADGLPAEVAATHLRTAETALEELLGVVSVDDVLDVVFREFCIGK